MKFYRKFFAVFLVLLITFSLFGCKKQQPVAIKSYAGIELVYYKMFDNSDVIDPYISQYITTHPGLKIRYRKFSDFNEYQNVILNEMAEGEGPDIFSMPNTWFISNYKKIKPVPQTAGGPKDFASTFVDVAYKDLVRPDADGNEQIYGIPLYVDNLALFYNKDHFEDRIPARGVPSVTWEGIKEDAYLLNKPNDETGSFDVSGIAMGRADNISRAIDTWYLLLLQHGADFYNSNMSGAVFASKKADYPALMALGLYTSFANSSSKNYSWDENMGNDVVNKEVDDFMRGKVSMIIGYSYYYDMFLNYLSAHKGLGEDLIDKSVIKIAPIPQIYDPNVSTQKRVTYANYFAETVSRNSDHEDLAWDFLLFMSNKKNLTNYFAKTHRPASRRDLIDDQVKDLIYGVFASQVGFAESFPIVDPEKYTAIFSALIAGANDRGAQLGDLVKAQDAISTLLPKDGILTKLVPLKPAN